MFGESGVLDKKVKRPYFRYSFMKNRVVLCMVLSEADCNSLAVNEAERTLDNGEG